MNRSAPSRCLSAALLGTLFAVSPLSAGITALNEGTHEWHGAPWSAGVPTAADTAFVNDVTKLYVVEGPPAVAEGIRMGNTVPQLASLQVDGSSLALDFFVLGDAANSNANFAQSGGELRIDGKGAIDFELGNPFNTPTAASYSIATFAAGKAELGNLRFNLREKRRSRLVLFGILPQVQAATLRFATGESKQWQPAELTFILSDVGIAPLVVRAPVQLGEGDRALLMVDGAKYRGAEKSFLLLRAPSIEGSWKTVELKGLPEGARVEVAAEGLWLRLP